MYGFLISPWADSIKTLQPKHQRSEHSAGVHYSHLLYGNGLTDNVMIFCEVHWP